MINTAGLQGHTFFSHCIACFTRGCGEGVALEPAIMVRETCSIEELSLVSITVLREH